MRKAHEPELARLPGHHELLLDVVEQPDAFRIERVGADQYLPGSSASREASVRTRNGPSRCGAGTRRPCRSRRRTPASRRRARCRRALPARGRRARTLRRDGQRRRPAQSSPRASAERCDRIDAARGGRARRGRRLGRRALLLVIGQIRLRDVGRGSVARGRPCSSHSACGRASGRDTCCASKGAAFRRRQESAPSTRCICSGTTRRRRPAPRR